MMMCAAMLVLVVALTQLKVKRHTCTQRSSITASLSDACTNDVELLDGSLERQPPTKFLFGRLMRLELENTLGCT
jgi:hypothetical protein